MPGDTVKSCPLHRVSRVDTIKALEAEHQKKLAATPALIQAFYLIRRQVAFFDGQQCVRHCFLGLRVCLVQKGGISKKGSFRLFVLNHSRPKAIEPAENLSLA